MLQLSAQAAEAESELADEDLLHEFEEAKRSRSLSSIFNGESDDDTIQVDASQQDESLSVSAALQSCSTAFLVCASSMT